LIENEKKFLGWTESINQETHVEQFPNWREAPIDVGLNKDEFRHTGLIQIIFPSSIEVLGETCFHDCRALSSVRFESRSRLSRIECPAFFGTGLIEIILPSSVEVLGEKCFYMCGSLSPITFESGSRLREIGEDVFLVYPIVTGLN
jgi:hypothetical protein